MLVLLLLHLYGELLCLGSFRLAVKGADVCLQLAELVTQQTQRQGRVQALVMQILERLQSSCHVVNQSLDTREALDGQLYLQRNGERLLSCNVASYSVRMSFEDFFFF